MQTEAGYPEALQKEAESRKRVSLVSKVRPGTLKLVPTTGLGPLRRHATPPLRAQAAPWRRCAFVAERPRPPRPMGAGHGGHWGPQSPRGPTRITGGIQKPLLEQVTAKAP